MKESEKNKNNQEAKFLLPPTETGMDVLQECNILCETFPETLLKIGINATEVYGLYKELSIDIEKVIPETLYSQYTFPGENGYIIKVNPRRRPDVTPKIYPELELSGMRYYVAKDGFLLALMNPTFQIHIVKGDRISFDMLTPLSSADEVRDKYPLAIEAMQDRVREYLSQGEPIKTTSERDYFLAGSVLKGDMPAPIVPNQDHNKNLSRILKRTVLWSGRDRPATNRYLSGFTPDF